MPSKPLHKNKNSGTGREGIKYSVEEMTELKLVTFKL
ncbi:hypothetical protein CYOC110262_18870 [Cytobacillus oceanisediminis]